MEESDMLFLENGRLKVHVLDPVADRARLGTRYCTAGFVFQIEDLEREGRPLLSGPTYPDSYNLYDGQGAPDAFQPALAADRGGTALGIGIGLIDTKANAVSEFAKWRIERSGGTIVFTTRQAFEDWTFDLERTLTLTGRTLRVDTRIANAGKRLVPFQWYPHPFWPVNPTGECCRMSIPVTLPDNPGYELLPDGFLRTKVAPPAGGWFLWVGTAADRPVEFLQRHPVLGLVAAWTDYVPAKLPVWGNARTFSFEPYCERVVNPGTETCWSISYAV
jgi:hypothetical protein